MNAEDFKSIRPTIPTDPGIYKYFDKEDKLLYVGKAKNLRNRVSSYFVDLKGKQGRIRLMISKIAYIRFTLVNHERDALLLENNLIKEHQPRYNISLKDDKSFPFICIKKERFPRVFFTRRLFQDGSEYFGPYTSVLQVRLTMDLIKRLFPLRTCKLNLSEKNVAGGKFKVCLEYHIGNCFGPCEGKQTVTEYEELLENIRQILKGNTASVLQKMKSLMNEFAENLEFEKAQQVKERIDALELYKIKSIIVNPKISNLWVFNIASREQQHFICQFVIENGSIIATKSYDIKNRLDESQEEILYGLIARLHNENQNAQPAEILVPFPSTEHNWLAEEIHFNVPKIGDKLKLLELCYRNAYESLKNKVYKDSEKNKEPAYLRILKQLKHDLQLTETPYHIECFDNSNIQGTNPVSAMVVFRNAKAAKKDYRLYNIKTVIGPNDFASMEEVVYRRYRRLLDEALPLPQLVIIDGGKGQLSSALKSIDKLELRGKLTVIGIAKRLEEIYFPNDELPLYINKRSESLKLIQQIRNEAHRFGISFHRKKRLASGLKLVLEQIEGIGPKTSQMLYKKYGSISEMKKAPIQELSSLIGAAKATIVFNYLQEN